MGMTTVAKAWADRSIISHPNDFQLPDPLLSGLHQHSKKQKQRPWLGWDAHWARVIHREACTSWSPGYGDTGEGISPGRRENCCCHWGAREPAAAVGVDTKQSTCFLLLHHKISHLASFLFLPTAALQAETKACSQRYKEPTVTLFALNNRISTLSSHSAQAAMGHSRCSCGNLRSWWHLQSNPVRNLGDPALGLRLIRSRCWLSVPMAWDRAVGTVLPCSKTPCLPYHSFLGMLQLLGWSHCCLVNITPVWSSHINTTSCPTILRQKWLKQCVYNQLVLAKTYLPFLRSSRRKESSDAFAASSSRECWKIGFGWQTLLNSRATHARFSPALKLCIY